MTRTLPGPPLRVRMAVHRLFGRFLPFRLPEPRPFAPRPVDAEAFRRDIDRHVDRLAPQAVDEATGHVLDNLINARSDAWIAELKMLHSQYQVAVERYLTAADAFVAWQGVLTRYQYERYADLSLAYEAARARLTAGYQRRAE